jgi:hypothetical protein
MDQGAVEKALGKVNMQGAARPAGKATDARVGQKDAVKDVAQGLNPSSGVR